MKYPNRGVHKNHCYFSAGLLRGIISNSFSVPPSFASLLLLSLAINASSPSLTRVVFSLMPVNSEALSINLSSIFNVVLMIFLHAYQYAVVVCRSQAQNYRIWVLRYG